MTDEKYPLLGGDNFDSGEFYRFLKSALIGRRIIKFSSRYIELDNGYIIKIRPNYGCDCGSGSAEISASYIDKPLDAAVMNVKYEEIEDYDERHHTGFKIFVYTKNEVIDIEGTDAEEWGGYYGSGFWLDTEMPEHRAQREAKEAEREAKAAKHPKRSYGAMGYMASRGTY